MFLRPGYNSQTPPQLWCKLLSAFSSELARLIRPPEGPSVHLDEHNMMFALHPPDNLGYVKNTEKTLSVPQLVLHNG